MAYHDAHRKSPRLFTHISGPSLTLHPHDAKVLGLEPGRIASVSTDHGEVHLPVELSTEVRRNSVFANMHWNEQFSNRACIDTLIGANLDPISGQPEFKAVPVAVEPIEMACFGYVLSTEKPNLDELFYWSANEVTFGWQIDFALPFYPDNVSAWLASTLSSIGAENVEEFEYSDHSRGDVRCIRTHGDRVLEIAFVSKTPVDISRDWLRTLIGTEVEDTFGVLAGVPAESTKDKGAIVCACMNVGQREIIASLEQGRCSTIDDLGNSLGAGANCGSCRPELVRLIEECEMVS